VAAAFETANLEDYRIAGLAVDASLWPRARRTTRPTIAQFHAWLLVGPWAPTLAHVWPATRSWPRTQPARPVATRPNVGRHGELIQTAQVAAFEPRKPFRAKARAGMLQRIAKSAVFSGVFAISLSLLIRGLLVQVQQGALRKPFVATSYGGVPGAFRGGVPGTQYLTIDTS